MERTLQNAVHAPPIYEYLDGQTTKRGLANAIITQSNSLIQTLTRDDLAMLLS